jgi:adenylate cyclase class 2
MKPTNIIEKEIKVLDVDESALREKIESLGGRKVFEGLTTMDWYDCTDGVQLRNSAEYGSKGLFVIREAVNLYHANKRRLFRESNVFFRLRKEGLSYDFTLKHKISDDGGVAHNREISVKLEDKDVLQVRRDLEKAGFVCIAWHQKRRVSYVLKQKNKVWRLDIDQWPGIPTYLEIEAEEGIFQALDQLELQNHELSTEVGERLFKKYGVNFYSDLKFS